MKVCPQCEFIYENDQSFCDMDGKELVHDSASDTLQATRPATVPELYESAPVEQILPVALPAGLPRWQSRGSAVAALAAIFLVALLFVLYFVRAYQARTGNPNQAVTQTSVEPSNQSGAAQDSAPDSTSEQASSATDSPEQTLSDPKLTTSSPASVVISSAAASSHGPMLINPVSAGGSAAENRAPVVLWLTNGSSIKADEAWQKKEGVWYRQGSMVTFLKRSQVRSIQRLPAANARVNSTNVEATRRPQNTAQNRPRVGQPTPDQKRPSRVTSFLKTTGRILKKPFKF